MAHPPLSAAHRWQEQRVGQTITILLLPRQRPLTRLPSLPEKHGAGARKTWNAVSKMPPDCLSSPVFTTRDSAAMARPHLPHNGTAVDDAAQYNAPGCHAGALRR